MNDENEAKMMTEQLSIISCETCISSCRFSSTDLPMSDNITLHGELKKIKEVPPTSEECSPGSLAVLSCISGDRATAAMLLVQPFQNAQHSRPRQL